MGKIIASELVKFKSTISPNLTSMYSVLNELTSKINELSSITKSTKNNVSASYFSENKEKVLSKFDQVNEIQEKIRLSLESELKSALTKSSLLVEKISLIESLNKEICDAENTIKNAGSHRSYNEDMSNKEEVDSYNNTLDNSIKTAQSILDTKRPEFDSLHEEALTDYKNLTGIDSTLKFTQSPSIDGSLRTEGLIGGDFVQKKYVASNGVKVEYYVYVPKYSTEVTDLPVHVYLHGDGQFAGGALTDSLPKLIADDKLNPNGIVICPQGNRNDGSYQWKSKEYRDALIELTNNVCSQYNGDSNRISLSGHSRGAIVGYQLLSENPSYFSAFVPVSGYSKGLENGTDDLHNLNNVNIWAFHGSTDTVTDYKNALHVMNQFDKNNSSNMEMYVFKGRGHSIQDDTFSGKFDYNGTLYNPLDWAFTQSKKS